MKVNSITVNEISKDGVLSFFKKYDWEVSLISEKNYETNIFNEDTQKMEEEKIYYFLVSSNSVDLFSFNISVPVSEEFELNRYAAVDLVRDYILKEMSFYLGDFYLEYMINKTMESIDIDEEDVGEKLKDIKGISNIKESDVNEERDCDKVSWDSSVSFTYKNKDYILYLSGTAIAEISYERWTETFGYVLDDWDLSPVMEMD